jgi:hypothetical protein
MYENYSRDSSNPDNYRDKGCSPLQNCLSLISLKPAIACFAYTQRCSKPTRKMKLLYIHGTIDRLRDNMIFEKNREHLYKH